MVKDKYNQDENDFEDFEDFEEFYGLEDNNDDLDFDKIPIKSDVDDFNNEEI